MTGDTELVTGDPRWHNFLPGITPLGLFSPGWKPAGHLAGMYKVAFERSSTEDSGNTEHFDLTASHLSVILEPVAPPPPTISDVCPSKTEQTSQAGKKRYLRPTWGPQGLCSGN